MDVSTSIADRLLKIGAVKINPTNPFTWSSGWKSPIYCDNRITLSYPDVRRFITEQLSRLVQEKFPGAEVIAGVATAGIPQGALVADALNLPYIYVRNKPKGHGMGNQIEGEAAKGAKIVLVEDLISTGGSSIKAAEACSSAGLQPLGIVSIFTYGFKVADENMEAANLKSYALSNYGDLIDHGIQNDLIQSSERDRLNAWRQDPGNWF
jgi:orotate phosphoribosyltransferase